MRGLIILAMAATAIPTVAAGQVVQGWTIGEVDDGCGMMMDYAGEGSTDLYFFEKVGGESTILARNYNWSAKDGEAYPMTFWLDRTPFSGEVTGMKPSDGKAGFVIKGNASFRKAFAAASGLTITRGETVVDDLSLKGSGAALATLSRCVARVRAKLAAEAREKARFAHIAKDPFASEPASAIANRAADVAARPVRPRMPPGAWITNDDYPPAAIRAEEQGTAGFRLSVDETGAVTDCEITSSSGSVLLDATTCSIMRRRARFAPAEDASGEKIPSTFASRFRWELPKN